jgi:hypothetical protein
VLDLVGLLEAAEFKKAALRSRHERNDEMPEM